MWKNKKFGKRQFKGRYRRFRKERQFMLEEVDAKGKKRNISFESHESAKKNGWKKCR